MTNTIGTPAPETTETPVTTEAGSVSIVAAALEEGGKEPADGVTLNSISHLDAAGLSEEEKAKIAADYETEEARKATNLANGLDEAGNSIDVDADGKHVDSTGPADGAAYDNKA